MLTPQRPGREQDGPWLNKRRYSVVQEIEMREREPVANSQARHSRRLSYTMATQPRIFFNLHFLIRQAKVLDLLTSLETRGLGKIGGCHLLTLLWNVGNKEFNSNLLLFSSTHSQ